jgi:hypothetical protein
VDAYGLMTERCNAVLKILKGGENSEKQNIVNLISGGAGAEYWPCRLHPAVDPGDD